MAELEILGLDEAAPEAEAPQGSDTYLAQKTMRLVKDLVLTQQSDHDHTPTADRGGFWLKDTDPPEPMFTDENGVDHPLLRPIECLIVAASDETSDLETGTAKITFRMPYGFELSEVRASVTTAPTGAALIVDINEAGTTILSTKITIDATEKTSTTAATAAVISDAALADDAEVTVDIDQIGSTIAGAGLKIYLIGRRAL